MNQRPIWMVAGLSACAITATAAANTTLEAWGVDPANTIVVTAKRTPQPIDDALSRVSVINREDIERSQARDIKDLLQTQAGLDLARTGGTGGQTSVFMRGSNSNHVLVLIDGIRVSAAGTGAFQWELVDLATVERIEIVRGPRAARWGSDAIGGVIQIFTRQATGLSVQATMGSYGERGGALAMGRHGQSLTASARRVDGFSAQNERGFAYNPDNDGFDHQQLAGQGSFDWGTGTLNWSGRWLSGEVEFDQGISDAEHYAGHVGYRLAHNAWFLSTDVGFYRDELITSTDFGVSENITRRTQISAIATREIQPTFDWSVGLDGWHESGVNVGTWREKRDHWGAWTAVDGQTGRLSYGISLRLDDDERYGQETTTQWAFGWSVNEKLRSFINAGQGFRSPNFSQLFSPGFGGLFAGNPLLKPETSQSIEWGWDFIPSSNQSLGISAFYSSIEDLINFSGPDFGAINIDEAEIKGLEFTHRTRVNRWHSDLSWTWQQAEDKALSQPLLRRAKSKGSWVLGYAIDDFQLSAELIYVGQRVDVEQSPLSPYTLINLAWQWPLNNQWSVSGRLENLAGADYEPLIGFNAPGRSAVISLSWKPFM